jgi:hypothetical protein
MLTKIRAQIAANLAEKYAHEGETTDLPVDVCKSLTVKERMEIFATTVKYTHDMGERWIETKTRRIFVNEEGEVSMNAILIMAVLAAVIFIVLANLFPAMQAANATIQANTATDAGTVTSKTIFGLLLWIIPLGIGLALLIRVLTGHND